MQRRRADARADLFRRYPLRRLALELEALPGRPVDLVTTAALRERIRPYVEEDLVDA